ncbi:Hypothetical predicted protein [Lynx pardinus]|uniref:Uncharacterized protein n=1 Tax=Lynx pardinus TaxID=191816 RepID=A0A485PG78_LYNPA|nr:Hypothetical predicted protein [Lynx pardinus]
MLTEVPVNHSLFPTQAEYTKSPSAAILSDVSSCGSLSSSEDGTPPPRGHSSLSDGELAWNLQDSVKHCVLYLSEQRRLEKASREENTVGYLKLVSKADQHHAPHICQDFEKVNQCASATITQIERRLCRCHRQLQGLEGGWRPQGLAPKAESSPRHCRRPSEKAPSSESPRPGGEDCLSTNLSDIVRHLPLASHFPALWPGKSWGTKRVAQQRNLLSRQMKEDLREVRELHLSLQVMISRFVEFEPHIGLCANRSEPGACFGFCVSLSLCSSPAHALSLSTSKKKNIYIYIYIFINIYLNVVNILNILVSESFIPGGGERRKVNEHVQGYPDDICHLEQNLARAEEKMAYLSYEGAKEIWLSRHRVLGPRPHWMTERGRVSWALRCHRARTHPPGTALALATVLPAFICTVCTCPPTATELRPAHLRRPRADRAWGPGLAEAALRVCHRPAGLGPSRWRRRSEEPESLAGGP